MLFNIKTSTYKINSFKARYREMCGVFELYMDVTGEQIKAFDTDVNYYVKMIPSSKIRGNKDKCVLKCEEVAKSQNNGNEIQIVGNKRVDTFGTLNYGDCFVLPYENEKNLYMKIHERVGSAVMLNNGERVVFLNEKEIIRAKIKIKAEIE